MEKVKKVKKALLTAAFLACTLVALRLVVVLPKLSWQSGAWVSSNTCVEEVTCDYEANGFLNPGTSKVVSVQCKVNSEPQVPEYKIDKNVKGYDGNICLFL